MANKNSKENISNKINSLLLLSIICGLIIYVFLRAYYLSFTHDECITYKIITGDNKLAATANNHLLNTWLMSIIYSQFGTKEILLRLPNVLAFILYSFFTYKILVKVNNIVLQLLGISFLLLNPYMLDFFSLARGYGISLGFGMASLYYFFKQNGFTSYKQYIIAFSLSLIFSLFSAYSNLVFINLNIVLIIMFLIELILSLKNKTIQLNLKRISSVLMILSINFILLVPLILRLFFLKESDQLYFGGADNFIDSTLKILIHRSIYFSYYGETFWIIVRQVIIVIYLVTIVYQICCSEYSHLSRITILSLLMIFATILQHYIFNILYPIERTSLIFIPLFGLFIYYLMSEIYNKFCKRNLAKIIFNLLVMLILVFPTEWHFVKNMNLEYTKEWKRDAYTREVIKTIMTFHDQKNFNTNKISISNSWIMEPAFNFYLTYYSVDFIKSAIRTGIDKNSDFIYCTEEDKEKITTEDHYIIVDEFKNVGTILLRKSNSN